MNTILTIAVFFLISYIIGAFSPAFFISRLKKVNLREKGSGNLGATNVLRVIGVPYGIGCLLIDCFKGFISVKIFYWYVMSSFNKGILSFPGENILLLNTALLIIAAGAIIGHSLPFYLKFKGGKGMSTCMGIVLGLYPYYTLPGLISFAVWIISVLLWRYVSLASIIAAVTFPISLVTAIILLHGWPLADLWPLLVVALVIPALVIARHVENIKRLLEGSEPKVLQRK